MSESMANLQKGNIKRYSNSEQLVGIWTDNKPVYRKTLSGSYGTFTDGTSTLIDCGLVSANMDKLISMNGIAIAGTNQIPLPYLRPTTTPDRFVNMFISDGHAMTRTNWSLVSGGDVYITVEYTKS